MHAVIAYEAVIRMWQDRRRGRLAQLVARFLHTEEVISSSLVSPTAERDAEQAPCVVLPTMLVGGA